VGAKVWSSVDDACNAVVRVATRISPDQSRVATMNAQYAAYRRVYPATKSIFVFGN